MTPEELRVELGKRIRDYREKQGIDRDTFAQKLGIKGPNLGNIERGEQLPTLYLINSLVTISCLPHEYWMDGEEQNKNLLQEPLAKYGEVIPVDESQMDVMYVPLVNEYAYAGYMKGFASQIYLSGLPKLPWIVDKEYRGNYMSFEVRGDSMDDNSRDSYIEGDILLCREVKHELWATSKLHIRKWDFVIAHKTEGIVVKKITEHNVERGVLKLHSLNDQYPDYEVELKDVQQIFNVVQVKRKK